MKDDQPTARQILDAVLHFQDSLDIVAGAVGRIELDVRTLKADVAVLKADVAVLKADVAVLKSDVAGLKADVARLEQRVIRIDERLAVIERARPIALLADHERRITLLERLSNAAQT